MKAFQKTRITLTAWYVGILAVILFAFSFVLYTGEQHDFVRIIVQRDFNSRVPHILTHVEETDVQNQLIAIRRAFLFNLLVVDGLVLLVGGGLSYFLAGKTLSPIQETFERQKRFLADVSHEIRTPLAAIQTATEVSLRTKDKTKQEYIYVLSQVLDETKRLTKMANDLLLLSRMESGSSIALQKVSLTKIVADVVKTFSATAEEKHITIATQFDNDVAIFGDIRLLTQLTMIFLDNAIKYTKSKGEITIVVQGEPKPRLVIQDTGIGISLENQKKIFERFFQVDSARSQSGNGLGLAIAGEIIQVHKAKVLVKSAVGKGSIFTIVFPN